MKTRHSPLSALTAAALVAGAAYTSHAQTWQMLLSSPAPGAAPAGLGIDLLMDPFNSVPAPGVLLTMAKSSLTDGTSVPSIIRIRPTDASWSSFSMEPMDGGLGSARRIFHNAGDGLYAAGSTAVLAGSTKGNSRWISMWKVRRSPEADQGNLGTWSDVDSFQFTGTTKGKVTAYDSQAHAITTDSSGNVYVCGWAFDGGVNHWIIRKKTSTGWLTLPVLDIKAADNYSLPYDICFVPAGGDNPVAAIFAVGLLNNRWTVLRSQNQGGSWQTVGPWPADGSLASAIDIASDSNGNVYVVGVRGRDGQNQGWVLRKSSDGGQTWSDLLDQPSTINFASWATRVAIDAANNITVAGAIQTSIYTPKWTIVRNSPGQAWSGSPTASWESRIFPLGANTPSVSKGRGMVHDANGKLFLTGDLVDWTDPEDGVFYSGTRVGLLRMVP